MLKYFRGKICKNQILKLTAIAVFVLMITSLQIYLHNTLMKYISKLSPREQIVTVMYYGLNGEEPRTLDAVGKVFGVSRERIRQILNKSQKKLKRYFELDNIRNYSDFN